MKFIQEPPQLKNQYRSDPILENYIIQIIPSHLVEEVKADLEQLGEATITGIYEASEDANAHEPILEQYDAWGNRVDNIITSTGWDQLKTYAALEGLVAIGYERNFAEYSRVIQFAKLLLYTPSSAMFTCPLAMTDGAARLIETTCLDRLRDTFNHLTTRDPHDFWTAGQWMTEKEGGSDVGRSSTIARFEDGVYRLYGEKWFTSAITAKVAMTLARIEEQGVTQPGNRGLSLFFLHIRDENGNLNRIRIERLKDKLGTRALPTAELTLDGAEAILIGTKGYGVKLITTILNTTRIYNSMAALSYMQRGLFLVKDYATRRFAFGKRLVDHSLHRHMIAELEVEYIGSFLLVFYTIELMGKSEVDKASEDELSMLRLLTPLIKLYTGKQVVAFMSEVVEMFGGIGYVEDSGIPRLLRDAQVFPIWEGTTNVLSQDVLRVLQKHGMQYYFSLLSHEIDVYNGELSTDPLKLALHSLQEYCLTLTEVSPDLQQFSARKLSMSMTRLIVAIRILVFQSRTKSGSLLDRKIRLCFDEFMSTELLQLVDLDESLIQQSFELISFQND